MNACIAIVAIGDKCLKQWEAVFAPSVRAYAQRFGYALEVFTEPIEYDPGRSPAWQKLLVAGHARLAHYDRIIYLDTDVLISPNAPDLAARVDEGMIGVVNWRDSYRCDPVMFDLFTRSWRENEQEKWRSANVQSFGHLQSLAGYDSCDDWLNSGVFVCSPRHAEFFRAVYAEPENEYSSMEQSALTHHLCSKRRDLLQPIDRRFNVIWHLEREQHYPFIHQLHQQSFVITKCVESTLQWSWFLHFAADGERVEARTFVNQDFLRPIQELQPA